MRKLLKAIMLLMVGEILFAPAYSVYADIAYQNKTFTNESFDSGVYGGTSINDYDDVYNNTITVIGCTNNSYVIGGSATDGTVYKNFVIVKGSLIRDVTGGGSYEGEVYDNVVTVTDSSIFSVTGGNSSDNNVYGNVVSIGNSTINNDVDGGITYGKNANNNKVKISNSIFRISDISGGRALISYMKKPGSSDGNEVEISNCIFSFRGNVYGGYSYGFSANSNTVTINNSKFFDGNIYGGYLGDDIGAATDGANNNKVILSGNSSAGDVYGGCLQYRNGKATNNIVTVNGGRFRFLYGGYILGYDFRIENDASNNTVLINGGEFIGDIYGGWVGRCVFKPRFSDGDSANNNTVIISGAADISRSSLCGSNIKTSVGNTLIIDNWKGTAEKINNFNKISFVNVDFDSNNQVVNLTTTSDLSNVEEIEIVNFLGEHDFRPGDVYTLIKNAINYTGMQKIDNISEKNGTVSGVIRESDDNRSIVLIITNGG